MLPTVLALVFSATFLPEDQSGWFPFVIPDLADAATAQSAIDLSFLSPEPAGSHGFLRADGERLVDDRGETIRLFGTNFTDYHPMMPTEFAEPVAARLQQLGINVVRFHYYDFAPAPAGITNDDRQTLNPEKLAQFDALAAALIRHGVWIDLNLHVARTYPGLPQGWNRMGKGLDLLHEPYIQSQLQFARDMLSHVNPHTGRDYAHEPGIAIIELNNENTALRDWTVYASLPETFRAPLRKLWNDWLRAKYRDTAGLDKAWGGGGLRGPELLRNGGLQGDLKEWTYQRSVGQGTFEPVADGGPAGGPEAVWDVTEKGAQSWHHQLQQPNLAVKDGETYTLTFQARATRGDDPRLAVTVMMQQEPWSTVASGATVKLTGEWKRYRVGLAIRNPDNIPVRLNLSCDNQPGRYELANLSLRAGSEAPLEPGETLEAGTVPLVDSTSHAGRAQDYVAFLLDRELDYIARMRKLLRDELGAQQMIVCTQVSYGGPCGLIRESTTAELIDNHTYPDHPREVTIDGKATRAVRNIALSGAGTGSLTRLAQQRVAGKPYTVSEFDLNPPNDHTSQVFPFLALMGAYQGWSGFMEYVWYNFGSGPGTDRIKSPWATVGDTAQIAFVPASALLFRQGLVEPAKTTRVLQIPRQTAIAATARDAGGWSNVETSQLGLGGVDVWRGKIGQQLVDGGGPATTTGQFPDTPANRVSSDTGQIIAVREEGRERVEVNAPAFRMVSGIVAEQTIPLGDLTLSFGMTFGGFAQAIAVSLDGQPLAQSKQVLLTVMNRAQSANMAYTADRTLATWGDGPTVAEPVSFTATLPGTGWRAQTLDPAGRVKGAAAMEGGVLRSGAGDRTVWYLVSR